MFRTDKVINGFNSPNGDALRTALVIRSVHAYFRKLLLKSPGFLISQILEFLEVYQRTDNLHFSKVNRTLVLRAMFLDKYMDGTGLEPVTACL